MPSTNWFALLFPLLLHSDFCNTIRSGLAANHHERGQEEEHTRPFGPDMAWQDMEEEKTKSDIKNT